MTVWKWRTEGVPPSTAFMPLITLPAVQGAYQSYKQHLVGEMGVIPIPAPNNDIPSSPLLCSSDSRSSDAPPYWWPNRYYEDRLPGLPFPAGANDAGVRVWSDNQLPVPAVEPQRGTHRLGGGQVVQPFQDTYRRANTTRRLQFRNA